MTDVFASHNHWPRNHIMSTVHRQQQKNEIDYKTTRRVLPKFKNDSSLRTNSRKIVLFRNGDRYFPGKHMTIMPQNYSHMTELLQDLSTTIELPYGVRRLFTPDKGSEITNVHSIRHGASYVCASFEPFQKLEYATINVPRITFNIDQCK
jgi:IS30 family transposase